MEFVKYVTKEEYESYREFLSSRGNYGGGCISHCICSSCYAKFYDSICCCALAVGFLCPKCGVDGSPKINFSVNPVFFAKPQNFEKPS